MSAPAGTSGSDARWIAFVAVWLVWVGLAMGQLNDLLGAMHVSGSPSFTVSDLNSFFHAGPDRAQSAGVLEVWKAQAVDGAIGVPEPDRPATAKDVVTLFTLIDSVLFVPLYTLFLLLVFRRARVQEVARVADLARGGTVVIIVTAVADLVENLALANVVRSGWGADLTVDASSLDTWLWVLWLAALVKWTFGGLAVLLAALVGWRLVTQWRDQRVAANETRYIHPAHLVGFFVALVIVAVVLFNQQGQLADLYRRWQATQLALSLVAATFAAFAVWAVTRRLLVRGPWAVKRTLERERRLEWMIVVAFLGAGIVQFGFHRVFDDARFDPGWGLLVPAGILLAVAVLGWPIEAKHLDEPRDPPARPTGTAATTARESVLPRLLAVGLLIGFAFALLRSSFGYAVFTRQWSWGELALLIAGAAVGAVVVPVIARRLPLGKGQIRRMAREPVTGAALVTLAVAIVLSAQWRTDEVSPSVLVGLSFLLVLFALRWFVALGKEPPPPERFAPRHIATASIGCIAVILLFWISAIRAGQWFSAPGVICAFLMVLGLTAGLLAWAAPGLPQPRALRAIGLEHFPVTAFIVLWFLIASFGDRSGAYHDARVREATRVAAPLSAQDALGCWLARHGLDARGTTAGPRSGRSCAAEQTTQSAGPIPLVFVASTGGGIRSAYWTALALDCAFEVDVASVDDGDPCPASRRTTDFALSDSLFLTSGISGGSLGQAEYAAHLVEKERGGNPHDWVDRAMAVDGLSPAGARWLFVESLRVFLQFDGPDDRAAILERAWEARWPEGELQKGLFEVARAHPHVPFLLLNSTSVGDGCRFNVSVLDASIEVTDGARPACRSNAPFDEAPRSVPDSPAPDTRVEALSALPATRDVSDLLCLRPLDVNLSTAALLSARFPFVNPAGRIPSRCRNEPRPAVVHGVDGGYLDTSGASPIVELMALLGPEIERWNAEPGHAGTCLVPFMIQIDNGFEDTSPPRGGRRPPELIVPLRTVFDTRIGRAAEARTAAAQLFTRPFPGARVAKGARRLAVTDRYAHFVNQAHPGPAAPFGWAQSRFSQRELESQLRQAKNRQALAEIRSWRTLIAADKVTCAS
jgi:hypothetical protein